MAGFLSGRRASSRRGCSHEHLNPCLRPTYPGTYAGIQKDLALSYPWSGVVHTGSLLTPLPAHLPIYPSIQSQRTTNPARLCHPACAVTRGAEGGRRGLSFIHVCGCRIVGKPSDRGDVRVACRVAAAMADGQETEATYYEAQHHLHATSAYEMHFGDVNPASEDCPVSEECCSFPSSTSPKQNRTSLSASVRATSISYCQDICTWYLGFKPMLSLVLLAAGGPPLSGGQRTRNGASQELVPKWEHSGRLLCCISPRDTPRWTTRCHGGRCVAIGLPCAESTKNLG